MTLLLFYGYVVYVYIIVHFNINSIYLWGHVIRCTTKCIRRFIQIYLKFTHSKIGDSHVTIKVQQYVIQLQIPVYITKIDQSINLNYYYFNN